MTRRLIKIGACVTSVALMAVTTDAALSSFNAFGLNASEVGYRAGRLSDYHTSYRLLGSIPFVRSFPTGEGHLLLGDDSSRSAMVNGQVISPSYFSTTTATYELARDLGSSEVVAHFRKLRYRWWLSGETDVKVDSFSPQVPGEKLPHDCTESHGWWNRKTGYTVGKIVETASVGSPYLWRTYEVLVHTGGNEFKQMSITTRSIYDCAVIALNTGETMKITYDDRVIRDPVTQATTYDLVSISR